MKTFTKPKDREETKLSTSDFSTFLERKPLYYNEIDYERFPRIFRSIEKYFKIPKIIHIVGTNGKGTTGRFLAGAMKSAGIKVGHYTSPHILRFNERIWIDGEDVDDAALQEAHERLQNILQPSQSEALSYFEYTTLMAMLCFEECEYAVLEAGLGGEHDATAVFPKILTVATPIDKDHEAFLGENIDAIATTKLGATARKLLLARQHHKEVEDVAFSLAKKHGAVLYKTQEVLTLEDEQVASDAASKLALPPYMQDNLKTAIAALKILCVKYSSESFVEKTRLFGRLTRVLPNVLLDVGHNPLAARSIAKALEGEKVVLVYNSYKDKNYKEILSVLSPIIKRVEILNIDDERIEEKVELQKTLKSLKLQYRDYRSIDEDEKYLVFGSFSVVEAFMSLQRHGLSME